MVPPSRPNLFPSQNESRGYINYINLHFDQRLKFKIWGVKTLKSSNHDYLISPAHRAHCVPFCVQKTICTGPARIPLCNILSLSSASLGLASI